jgi:hypothetical protein
MKKIIIVFLFAFMSHHLSAQWVSQNIPGNLYFLNGIDFLNAQTGAVGGWYGGFAPRKFSDVFALGRALYTTNGGTNWIYANIPDSLRVVLAVQFIDQQNVYGFGVKNITSSIASRTTDSNTRNGFDKPRFTASFNPRGLRVIQDNYSNGMQEGLEETRGYFLKSTNGGLAWQYYGSMPPEVTYLYEGLFINGSTGFASAITTSNSYNKSGIVRTTNGGLNWNFVSPADSFQNYRRMEFPTTTTGFAVGEHLDTNGPGFTGLILRTTNGGSNWTRTKIPEINNFKGVSFSNALTGIAVGTSNDNIYGAHFYKTTNAGASWFKLPFQEDTAFADGINMVAGTGRGFAFGEKFKADPLQPGNFIPKGLFIDRTTDYGLSWHKSFYPDTEGILINSTDIDQNTWYISGGNIFISKGIVLKTTNGGGPIGINSISLEIPMSFNVYQNYPNPFNPLTKIKFDLPKSGNVSFKVFDVLGRLVYELNEFKSTGIYEVSFDAQNYSSGIYYYRIESGGFKQTKKMVLLK